MYNLKSAGQHSEIWTVPIPFVWFVGARVRNTSEVNMISFLVTAALLAQVQCDMLPPHWSEGPHGLKDYPLVNGSTVIDPWNYLDRMGMYHILLEETREAMTSFGPGNTGNILWGLPLQHGWQFSSGRLRNFRSHGTNCPDESIDPFCISVTSWWAGMNYYLSVIPFMGAINAGYFSTWPHPIVLLKPGAMYSTLMNTDKQRDQTSHDELSKEQRDQTSYDELSKESDPELYCVTVQECLHIARTSTEAWTDFFIYLCNISRCEAEGHECLAEVSSGRSKLEDDILRAMWSGHVDSLKDAVGKMSIWLPLMSQPEQQFGLSWADCVEFLAATLWPTDLETTHRYQEDDLPKRILQEGDIPPNIPDMTPEVNSALAILNKMAALNNATDGAFLKVWKYANCSPSGRAHGRQLLGNVGVNPLKTLSAFIGLVYDMIFVPCE